MASKINMTLPIGVCEKDGQVFMTREANKKFCEKYGDVIPKIENRCLCIPIKRRTVFLDHDMNMVKAGTVCVLTNGYAAISMFNISNNCENIPGCSKSLGNNISTTCHKMLNTPVNFEFMEITNEKFTKYIPLQFNRRFIYVVVTKKDKIFYEELIEEQEEDFNKFKPVLFIEPNGWEAVISLSGGKWVAKSTLDTDLDSEYVVGVFRV